MVNVNRLLKGSSGNVWLGTELLANLISIEAKVKGEFSDHNFCGDPATYSSFDGWSGEGTLTFKKIDSSLWSQVAEAYLSGVMPDITITTCLTDKSTNKSERVRISGIVFTEFTLAGFKAKETVEEEFPFKFSNYQVLETIA